MTGDQILLYRRDRNLTQKSVCIEAGISEPVMVAIERGKVIPTEEVAAKIVAAINKLAGERGE